MQPKHNSQMIPAARQLRKEMTREERHLWYDFLKGYPVRFSRQKILGRYIVDFYCAQAGMVIELDGSQHYEPENAEKDTERTAFLAEYGLQVVRIPNHWIWQQFDDVCAYIDLLVRRALERKRGGDDRDGDEP